MQQADLNSSMISYLPMATAVLVPGWAWFKTERRVWLRCKTSWQVDLFHFVLYSLFLYMTVGLVSPLFNVVSPTNSFSNPLTVSVVGFSLIPIAVLGGVVTGICGKHDAFGHFLRFFGMHTTSRAEMGWQLAFQRPTGCLVRLRYKSGKETFALFNDRSVVPEPNEKSDAFFERVFEETPDGGLIPSSSDLGVWVRMNELDEIRLYDYMELANERKQEQIEYESDRDSSESAINQGRGDAVKTNNDFGIETDQESFNEQRRQVVEIK